MRLYKPTAGEIIFDGKDIAQLSAAEVWPYRKRMQMIFQDPYASLNPRMTVSDIIGEPLDIYHLYEGKERQERIYELLNTVGLGKDHASRYPHEFSGGQRQRVGIARALAVNPEVILMDEPTSALDPISTSKIEDLVIDLKNDYTIIMVTHNMQQATRVSDETVFFLLGEVIESGNTEQLFSLPQDKRTEDYITGRFG